MDRNECRKEIDGIDERLTELFVRRMDVAGEIAEYKKEHGLPVLDAGRERDKLSAILSQTPENMSEYVSLLYQMIFELSRSYQQSLIGGAGELTARITYAIENTPRLFPSRVPVACQGVEGAYSQLACDKLVRDANIMFLSSFEAVFSAVENGLCRYGVVPLENSTAGSVNSVYDLMMRRRFSIVRSVRLKIDHNLLVNPGVRLEDIREIYSHEQAIAQCQGFLQSLPGVRVIPCENTAVAARRVAEAGRRDAAAISSRACAPLYGLECLREAIQDKGNNYTRFICISKTLEIYPGANRTSLMATLPHKPGALYKLLSRFYALGINLDKLESRPIPDRDFEFMFYFDLDAPVYSPQLLQLMDELGGVCESFAYLGSYSEVI